MNLQKEGYQPAEINTGGTIAKGGLGRRTPNPAAQGPGKTVTDTRGKNWFLADKPDSTPQQRFADLREALNQGWQQADASGAVSQHPTIPRYQMDAEGHLIDTGLFGAHVPPPEDWQRLQVPGGPMLYKPGEAEQQQDQSRGANLKAQREEEFKNFTLPKAITSRLESQAKLPEGTLKGLALPRSEMREILTGLAGKTNLPHIVTRENDAGDVTTTAFDQETGAIKWTQTQKGAGLKHRDPDAPKPEKPASKARIASIRNHYRDALDRAQKARDRAIQASSFNGEVWDQAGAREAFETYSAAKQEAQDRLREDLQDYNLSPEDAGINTNEAGASAVPGMPSGAPPGPPRAPIPPELQSGGTPAMRSAPQGPTQAGGAQNGPPSRSASPLTKQAPRAAAPVKPGSKGVTTIGTVQRYAEKHGLTLSEAVRQATSEGYAIKGQ